MRVHGVDIVASISRNETYYCTEWHLRCESEKKKKYASAFASLVSACRNGSGTNITLTLSGGEVKAVSNHGKGISPSMGNEGTANVTSSSPLETVNKLITELLWFKVQVNGIHIESTIICASHGDSEPLMFYDLSTGAFTSTPSQATLKSWGLKLGFNDVEISILPRTEIKGKGNIASRNGLEKGDRKVRDFSFGLFLYSLRAKFAIVDIDGTITISDVRGYVESVFLGVYTHVHEGVVRFLKVLEENFGYSLIFLTSRPLAHQEETRLLLSHARDFYLDVNGKKCIDHTLQIPRGPLFMNTKTISKAVYGEVIAKSSGSFKLGVLRAIGDVFTEAGKSDSKVADEAVKESLPLFRLGVGNRETDMMAYHAAGVPEGRMLLVDSSSNVRLWSANATGKGKEYVYSEETDQGAIPRGKERDRLALRQERIFSSYADQNLLYYLDDVNLSSRSSPIFTATKSSSSTQKAEYDRVVHTGAGDSSVNGALKLRDRNSSTLSGPQSNVMKSDER